MELNILEWQKQFNEGAFDANNYETQCKAGWYDWFCKTTSLANKTKRMGRIVKQVKAGGKVDVVNWYVWFKNNCPMVGNLFDDFRFADLKTGATQFTISLNSPWDGEDTYKVYGIDGDGQECFDHPLFTTNSSKELVKWLNTPWENQAE